MIDKQQFFPKGETAQIKGVVKIERGPNASTDPVFGVVYETYQYSKFSEVSGNREKNETHVLRLLRSFMEEYLVRVIIVNEQFKVIDGQHTLEAAERAGKPVRYIVVPNYGLKQVQRYNTHVATWKKVDYLQSYSDLGVEAYQKMQEFMELFPDFGIGSAEAILSQLSRGANNSRTAQVDGGKRVRMKSFEEGKFEIPDWHRSLIIAERIMQIKQYYKGFNRLVFVHTMLGLLKNPVYDHKQMIHKLSLQPTKLVDCANVDQYKLLLEEIYNWKQGIKVSFRY